MGESTSGNLTLPGFEKDKTYLLKGETLNQICDVIRENKVVLTGKKQWEEIGPEGSKIDLDPSITGAITVTTEDVSGYTPGTGVATVADVTTLTFDQDLFEIFDGGGGQCVVRLITTECA